MHTDVQYLSDVRRDPLAEALERFHHLTRAERDILYALAVGLSPTDIARTRYLSITTVRTHIRAVLYKLGVSSQTAALAMLITELAGERATA